MALQSPLRAPEAAHQVVLGEKMNLESSVSPMRNTDTSQHEVERKTAPSGASTPPLSKEASYGDEEEYPDGGTRAWMMVLGVRRTAALALRCHERFTEQSWTRTGSMYNMCNVHPLFSSSCGYDVPNVFLDLPTHANSNTLNRSMAYPLAALLRNSFGVTNSWGVFQSLYEEDRLRNVPPSTMCAFTSSSTI